MIAKPAILFAVHGLEHPEDYYQVFEHSSDDEKPTLLHDHETFHMLNTYQGTEIARQVRRGGWGSLRYHPTLSW
jgi:hypothetical protein